MYSVGLYPDSHVSESIHAYTISTTYKRLDPTLGFMHGGGGGGGGGQDLGHFFFFFFFFFLRMTILFSFQSRTEDLTRNVHAYVLDWVRVSSVYHSKIDLSF